MMPFGALESCTVRLCRLCVCVCAHLDHSQQALVGGGVRGDGEAARGVSSHDAVDGAPGLSVRLVFIRHR